MHDGSIPIVLGFDVEPDPRHVDRHAPSPWAGFERLHDYVTALRDDTRSAGGVPPRFSWFLRMDEQIRTAHGDAAWAATQYAGRLAASAAAGDSLGLHVHAFRWDDAAGGWLVDDGDPGWVARCVRTSAEAFHRAFGRACMAYRMGDRFLDDATLAAIESVGGRIDLSVEPGYPAVDARVFDEPRSGALPDTRAVPRHPYRPARVDFRRIDRDARAIWVVPLTTWALPPLFLAARTLHLMGAIARGSLPRFVLSQRHTVTLGLTRRPAIFRRIIAAALAAGPAPYLASIDRSEVANHPANLTRIGINLRYLLTHPQRTRFAFVDPEQLVQLHGARTA